MAPRLKLFTPEEVDDLPVELESQSADRRARMIINSDGGGQSASKDAWQGDNASRGLSETWTSSSRL